MLNEAIKIPTISIINFVGNLVVILAAKGAINNPPEMSPKIVSGLLMPTKIAKDKPVEVVIKNSAEFTEPMVFLGSWPLDKRVVVTTGPQPPPPTASIIPPVKASGVIFLELILVF
jgi:hypothetical protein